jgi:hypothetical protein
LLESSFSEVQKKGLPQGSCEQLEIYFKGLRDALNKLPLEGSQAIMMSEVVRTLNDVNFLKNLGNPSFWNSDHQDLWLSTIDSLIIIESSRYIVLTFTGRSREEDQLFSAVEKLKSLLSEAIANQSGLDPTSQPWTIIQKKEKDTISGWFVYHLANQWNIQSFALGATERHSRITRLTDTQVIYFENPTSTVIQLLDSKTIFASCSFDPFHASTAIIDKTFAAQIVNPFLTPEKRITGIKQFVANLKEKAPPLTLSLIFYAGAPIWGGENPNTVEFKASLDSRDLKVLSYEIDPRQNLNDFNLRHFLALIEVNKEKWVDDYLSKYPLTCTFECSFPNSRYDWAFTECLLYKTLKEDPVKHAELICWLAENQELELTEEDLQKHASEEEKAALGQSQEVELSPKTLVNIIYDRVSLEMGQALAEEKSSANSTINVQLRQEDKHAAHRLESTKEKKKDTRILPKNKVDQKKYDGKQHLNQQLDDLHVGNKEQEKIKSVFFGQPLAAKEFNKLVIKLVTNETDANLFQEGRGGSHHSVRFKSFRGGKTGQTLWHPHGKQKDNELSVHSQKRTLKHILGL